MPLAYAKWTGPMHLHGGLQRPIEKWDLGGHAPPVAGLVEVFERTGQGVFAQFKSGIGDPSGGMAHNIVLHQELKPARTIATAIIFTVIFLDFGIDEITCCPCGRPF